MILVNDREKITWFEGITIQDILNELNWTYSLITVSVNEEIVPKEDYETFIINDNSKINIFHLAHGG
jgi:thiamine biosynthesis protein ThiS